MRFYAKFLVAFLLVNFYCQHQSTSPVVISDYLPPQIGNVWVYEITFHASCTSYETVKTILTIEVISNDTIHSGSDYLFRLVSISKLTPNPRYGIPYGKDTLEHTDTQIVSYSNCANNLCCNDSCNAYLNEFYFGIDTNSFIMEGINFNTNITTILKVDESYLDRQGTFGKIRYLCKQVGLLYMDEKYYTQKECGPIKRSVKLISFNNQIINYKNTNWLCDLRDSCDFIEIP